MIDKINIWQRDSKQKMNQNEVSLCKNGTKKNPDLLVTKHEFFVWPWYKESIHELEDAKIYQE